ncbi:MAG: glycosyltransferase [Saprospiraceae bacterium]
MHQANLHSATAVKGVHKSDKALSKAFDLVVFSHLRWDFVTQRPQHVIGRFAKDRKVLFVEEPIGYDPRCEGRANIIRVNHNLTVLQPCINHDNLMDELEPIVKEYMQRLNITNPNLWFYSAAFHEMTERIPHQAVIYDCMDELSAFRGASKALIKLEKQLIQKADVIFTGGKSLYEAKRQLSENVYCYPSSVDREHFEKALEEATVVPDDMMHIPHPIVGYYGVIDERIDLPLLDEIAQLRPNVSFVMIGPVVKISEADLPRHANLYYPGGKPYGELPAYLKAIDIAMMPFALNESTQFISPTKTLEYIAALKPIISTPIYDVKRDYSNVLAIINNAAEFVTALDQYLAESNTVKEKRYQDYESILQAVSWDKTVAGMKRNIDEAMTGIPQRSAAA